jgi:hypothetical protein
VVSRACPPSPVGQAPLSFGGLGGASAHERLVWIRALVLDDPRFDLRAINKNGVPKLHRSPGRASCLPEFRVMRLRGSLCPFRLWRRFRTALDAAGVEFTERRSAGVRMRKEPIK